MLLPQDLIRRVHAATISAGLDNQALLSGIPPQIAGGIPLSTNRMSELLLVLGYLNQMGTLPTGDVPLRTWIENAIALTGPRVEARVFEEALARLPARRQTPPEPSHGSGSPPLGRPPEPPQQTAPKPPQPTAPVRAYVSFSPRDERFAQLLETHLAPMLRAGDLAIWHRGKLAGWEDREARAQQEIDEADLAIVFLSPDYFADNEPQDDLEKLLVRMKAGQIRILPILARPIDYEDSPLGRIAALPRDGRPIIVQRNADEAYVAIVRQLRAVAQDLKQQKATRPAGPQPARAPASSSTAPAGTPIEQIFCRNGAPTYTYVPPREINGLRVFARTMGRGLVVEGPAQIGKSTLLARLLPGLRRIDCKHPSAPGEIRDLIRQGRLTGHVVIDDAHRLQAPDLAELARHMRWLADQPSPEGKVTLVGINKTGRRLVEGQRDLAGRIDEVRMSKQPDDTIRDLIEKGEQAANVRFSHKAEVIREANGSLRLAQELCFWLAIEKINRAAPASPPVQLDGKPEQVRDSVKGPLRSQFDEPLRRFAQLDEQSGCRGVCLALLWLLADATDLRVTLGQARAKFPTLDAGFDWINAGKLRELIDSDVEVAELIGAEGGEITIQDPQLEYYLWHLDWNDLSERAQRRTRLVDGQLVVGGVAQTGMSPRDERSILDMAPPYPWAHPRANRLFQHLLGAYEDIERIRLQGKLAGVTLGTFTALAGTEGAWRSLLDAAAAQGKLRDLMNAVLADPEVAAHKEYIEECIAPDRREPASGAKQ